MNIKALLVAALALFSGLVSLSPARADAIIGNFTIDNGNPSASGGQVIFTLDANGQISASLTTNGLAGPIVGFGFDACFCNLPESNFSTPGLNIMFGWDDLYGFQYSGFGCYDLPTGNCGMTETWTIGNPGDYTSVYQVLGGGDSTYPLVLITGSDAWAANAAAYSAVPEPGTLALFGMALLALGGSGLRKKSA